MTKDADAKLKQSEKSEKDKRSTLQNVYIELLVEKNGINCKIGQICGLSSDLCQS